MLKKNTTNVLILIFKLLSMEGNYGQIYQSFIILMKF